MNALAVTALAVSILTLTLSGAAVAGSIKDPHTYNGAASCTQAGCHELTAPAVDSNVDRNEYAIWSQGPHSKSYLVLLSDQANRIARNMGVGTPTSAGLCLDCHTTNAPAGQHGALYNVEEGVSCESCHGASGIWLDTHHDLDVTIEELRDQGLRPTHDPIRRAAICLDCHFGASDQFAGHRLLAAGHPRVSFELDSYTEINAHHTVDEDYVERKSNIDGVRVWAVGQAMATERRMSLLADPQTGTLGFFPEMAFFDCHGCHAPMSVKRKASVNKRGQPKFDDAHMKMLRIAMSFAEPGLGDQISGDIRRLHAAASQNRGAVVAAAKQMQATAQRAVESLATRSFDGAEMREILGVLANNGASGQFSDYATAEQTALVIDSTLAALINGEHISDADYDRLSAVLDEVFSTVESDDRYSAGQFTSAMRSFQASLP
ncbi:MAG: cytochrome c family protein [Pseudomonadota bacterium]